MSVKRSLAGDKSLRHANKSTSSLAEKLQSTVSNQASNQPSPRDSKHPPHISSSAQIIVNKMPQGQPSYVRKSKHQDALESAGPTAYYTEFDESKLPIKRVKQRLDT